MPAKEMHLAAAKRNQATLEYLLQNDDHLAWVVTVAFYKALHVIEAVFEGDSKAPVKHTDDHKQRNGVLKKTNRYHQLWKMYRPLWEASLIARYLRVDDRSGAYDVFSDYLSREDVVGKVLNHYLRQIENTARNLLDDPGLLT